MSSNEPCCDSIQPYQGEKMAVALDSSLTVKLTRKKERLESELEKINEAIEIVTRNPEIQKVLDTVSSINRLI